LFTFGMTVTSIDLAMDNYTQVEKLGAKSAVHVLAVLKPRRIELVRARIDPAVQPYYKEITYPLDAGIPPNPDYYQPANMPRTKIYSHARQLEPIGKPPRPISEDIGNSSEAPTPGPEIASSNDDSLEANGGPRPAKPTAPTAAQQNACTKERLSERDLQATRTFAILPMLEVGENPWDLGSRLLNFKTVMGTGLLDWFLPIRRSPCCGHEDAESQYAMGPGVDLLKSSVGFIPSRETDKSRRRRRRKRTHQRRTSEGTSDAGAETRDPDVISSQPNRSIPLQNINNLSTSPQPT
jgi:palmitoyltransferase